jgi:RTX calcium-binding nonapeptide repeat (4 copies)
MMAQVPSRHAREAVWALSLLCIILASPATAPASVRVSVDEGNLLIRAEGTELNVVDVRRDGPAYRIYDPVSPLISGSGCLTTGLGEVLCSAVVGAAVVRGGDGSDAIDLMRVPLPVDADGGPGDDALRSGANGGILRGGPGVDQLLGGKGADRLEGEGDDDLLEGRPGADTAFGGKGADVIIGGAGPVDVLVGGSGADLIKGGHGRDFIDGGAGPDSLAGGLENDRLSPGTGEDRVFARDDADVLQCPAPIETAGEPTPSCADVLSRQPPDSWPPASGRSTATARSSGFDGAWATPVVRGNASGVRVHIPAKTWHAIRVCIHTEPRVGRAFPRYHARTTTKFTPIVWSPSPRRASYRADVFRAGAC